MSETKKLQKLILDLVYQENYRPIKPKAIANQLDLPDEEREIKRTIKRLIKDGQLTWGPQHLVLKTDRPKVHNEIIGVFRKAQAGYGFVNSSEDHSILKGADVFIPERKTLDASDGDRVRVRLSKQRKENRRHADSAEQRFSGRILEVVERRTNQFVGTYRERGGYGLVEVDGSQFDTDILVGDAGAKNCRAGDKVVIEMVQFPSAFDEGEGVIVEVLGPRGKAGVDTLTIVREFGLPGEFSEQVLQEARNEASVFEDEEVPEDRTDFTNTTVVTIDPKEARDFDDAISLEQLENGHWRLGVHIADVSHFVRPNSDLDNEAYQRATSVYLPDKVIPMLPEIISNNLASLQPNRNRFVMTAVIEFTADGAPVATDLHRGVIRSAHRFNYEEIDDYLEDDRPWRQKLDGNVFQLVRRMHTLAMILRDRRMNRGAIELTLPEVKIVLDEEGRACGAKKVEHTESHQVIEEFMLAANEAVAREMADRGLFLIRRIHEAPAPAKLKDLTAFVKSVGIQAGSLQDRFEIKRVIKHARGLPEEYAVHFAVLRSMQKAIYSPKEVGHYALASQEYCHFTSPIRRYPDLIIHRMGGAIIEGKKPATDFQRLTKLGQHCSELEQRAEQAERNLIRLKLLNLLAEKQDEEFDAVVTGVESFGIFAQLRELPADGLIPIRTLPADRYEFDKATRTISGFRSGNQFRLGDAIRVRIAKVDPDRRELELELVRKSSSSKTRAGKSRPVGGRKKKVAKKGARAKVAANSDMRATTVSGDGAKKKKKATKKSKKKARSKLKVKTAKAKSGKARAKKAAKRKTKAAIKKRIKAGAKKKSKRKRR